jgi:PPOX class probable F420-dependent enzyme
MSSSVHTVKPVAVLSESRVPRGRGAARYEKRTTHHRPPEIGRVFTSMEIGIVTPPGQRGGFGVGARETGRTLEDLPDSHLALLDEPVTASMACLNGNGTIHISPVWVSRDKTNVFVNSVRGRQKDRNLRVRHQVSLLFIDLANPYHWMSIQGDVVEILDEDDPVNGALVTEGINRLSHSYLGAATYPLRDPDGGEVRSQYRIRPNRVQVFGAGSA